MATTAKEATAGTSEIRKEVRDELADIRKDIAALANSVAKLGRTGVHDLQDQARVLGEDLSKNTQKTVEELRAQVGGLEAEMEKQVREHPLQSLLIAVGAGFLLSLLVSRRP